MHHDQHHVGDADLLRALDDELPAGHREVVERHLVSCETCRQRSASIAEAGRSVAELYRESTESETDRSRRLRAALQMKLHTAPAGSLWISPRWALVAATLAVAVMGFRLFGASAPFDRLVTRSAVEPDALPVAALTPGAAANVTAAELCAGHPPMPRTISAAVRDRVLRSYGMEMVPPDQYELDFLITPELGGTPEAGNLWPERYSSRTWNAHVKDALERLLPEMVCGGQLDLATAQRDMAVDWIAAYRKYFKTEAPLKLEASLLDDDDRPRIFAGL